MKLNKIRTRDDIGTWVRCPSPMCGNHRWVYRGHSSIYATCPSRKRNVLISKNKIEWPLRSVGLGQQKQIEMANVGGVTA
jgi:hypothetical protein